MMHAKGLTIPLTAHKAQLDKLRCDLLEQSYSVYTVDKTASEPSYKGAVSQHRHCHTNYMVERKRLEAFKRDWQCVPAFECICFDHIVKEKQVLFVHL